MIYYNLLRPLFPVCKSPSALPNREIREPPPAIGFRQYAVVFIFGRLTFSKNAPMNHEIARKKQCQLRQIQSASDFRKKSDLLKGSSLRKHEIIDAGCFQRIVHLVAKAVLTLKSPRLSWQASLANFTAFYKQNRLILWYDRNWPD